MNTLKIIFGIMVILLLTLNLMILKTIDTNIIELDYNFEKFKIGLSYNGAFNQLTNNSVDGVYVNAPTIVIPLNDRNIESLNNTLHHEYLHWLINSDQYYHNESARSHFCGWLER